jgi:hypothetical protein
MKTKSLVRRFGSALTILGIAAFLWGCGQVPTAPMDDQQVTQDLSTQGDTNQWW